MQSIAWNLEIYEWGMLAKYNPFLFDRMKYYIDEDRLREIERLKLESDPLFNNLL